MGDGRMPGYFTEPNCSSLPGNHYSMTKIPRIKVPEDKNSCSKFLVCFGATLKLAVPLTKYWLIPQIDRDSLCDFGHVTDAFELYFFFFISFAKWKWQFITGSVKRIYEILHIYGHTDMCVCVCVFHYVINTCTMYYIPILSSTYDARYPVKFTADVNPLPQSFGCTRFINIPCPEFHKQIQTFIFYLWKCLCPWDSPPTHYAAFPLYVWIRVWTDELAFPYLWRVPARHQPGLTRTPILISVAVPVCDLTSQLRFVLIQK